MVPRRHFLRKTLMLSSLFSKTALLAIFALSLPGCGGGVTVSLVPVSGVITLDGKPLSNAKIVFMPQASADKKKAPVEDSSGMSDAEGKFVLQGLKGNPGAVPGTHKVVVSKMVTKDGKDVVPSTTEDPALALGNSRELLVPQYSNPLESTLTATVPEKGGTVNLELKSRP